MSITWDHALAWRMQRQLLEPVGAEPVEGVVRRLGAVLAMDEGAAELAVGTRRAQSRSGDLGQALEDGRVIKAFAFRGAVHYLSAEDAGAYLALRASGRQWELPGWQEYYELKPTDWPEFRAAVRQALAQGPLTVDELGDRVTRTASYRHLRPAFDDGAGTLIKPLTWQGDMSLGPRREGQQTFQRLDDNPHWKGVWDLHEAGLHAISAYFHSYGPATHEHLHYWLGNGLSAGRKRLQVWLAEMADRLMQIDVGGEPALVLQEDIDELMAAQPTAALRLLPGHDQWVMGPGTKDTHIVPPTRRAPVTRKADLVVVGGVVHGTWLIKAGHIEVTWFGENGAPPLKDLTEQVGRLSAFLDRPLTMNVKIG